jgi:hypothetical protein
MKWLIKDERGTIIVITAGAMLVIMMLAAMAVDVGSVLTARNQLQSAVDAAALAGASGLTVSEERATDRAILFASRNTCHNQPVQISAADVTFPAVDRIRVQGNLTVNTFFARAFGVNAVNISAVAVAELGRIIGTGGTKPWALPDRGEGNWPLGEPIIIKSGHLGAPGTNPGFFYPVDFPPLNRGTPIPGAQEYLNNIIYGSKTDVFIDDILVVEPGNMIGPTKHGVLELIAMDPNAYWSSDANCVMGSAFGEKSPRIIKVPLYDPDYPPDSGKNTVIVVKLAAFFVTGFQGKSIMGVFLEYTTSGHQGEGSSTLRGARLIS